MNKAVTKRVAMHGTGREYLRRLSADIRRDRWLYALLVPGESLLYACEGYVLEAHLDADGVLSCLILRDAMPEPLY